MLKQGTDGIISPGTVIPGNGDMHALGQCLLFQAPQLGLDGISDSDRIGSRALGQGNGYCRHICSGRQLHAIRQSCRIADCSVPFRCAFLNTCYIFQKNGLAIMAADNHITDILRGTQCAIDAQRNFVIVIDQMTTRQNHIVALQGLLDIFQTETGTREFGGVEPDIDRLPASTNKGSISHIGHILQLIHQAGTHLTQGHRRQL